MITRSRLWEPHIPGVPRQLSTLESPDDGIAIADLAAGRVHEVRAALHFRDQCIVEEAFGLRVQRRVDRHDVAHADQRLRGRMKREAQFLFDGVVEPVPIGVMQLDVEGLETPKHRRADAACRDGADVHALQVIGACDAIRNVPAAIDDPLMGRQVVADQREDHHHHVLGHADAVAVGHLGDGDAPIHRRLQVDVIRADTGSDRELQIVGLADSLLGQVGGPERLRDNDVGVGQLPLEHAIRSVLVRGDDERVTLRLEKFAQPELAGHAAEQVPRGEVDRPGCWSGLAAGVALDARNIIACIGAGIPADGVFIEHTDDFRHGVSPSWLTVTERSASIEGEA